MAVAPCKDCLKKGCGIYHDRCPDYMAYKEAQKKENDERKERMKYELDYKSMEVERVLRRRKEQSRLKQR